MEITITFDGNKKINAHVNGHVVRTDQPTQGGGDGTAPAPYEIFLASLGTCAGIYIKGFLDSRGLSADGVTIKQRHGFDPMTYRLANVELDVVLPPEIPEKYHSAIVRAASLCAVKKTLADPPHIDVKVSNN